MNIRYIGFNWGSERGAGSQLGYLASTDAVLRALSALGANVDRTPVSLLPGEEEDLSRYDRIVINVSPPSTMMSVAMHGSLFALSRYWERCRCTVDDFQASGIQKGFAKGTSARTFGDDKFVRYKTAPWARKNATEIEEIYAKCASVLPPILVPCRQSGDPFALELPGGSDALLHSFDPSAFHNTAYTDGAATAKHRRFVIAALHDHSDWVADTLEPAWEKLFFGCRSLGAERLKEADMYRDYLTTSWFHCCPPYGHAAKSGWYRGRFPMACSAQAIVVGDADELRHAYGGLQTPDLRELHASSDAELLAFAAARREAYLALTPSIDETVANVEGWLK